MSHGHVSSLTFVRESRYNHPNQHLFTETFNPSERGCYVSFTVIQYVVSTDTSNQIVSHSDVVIEMERLMEDDPGYISTAEGTLHCAVQFERDTSNCATMLMSLPSERALPFSIHMLFEVMSLPF